MLVAICYHEHLDWGFGINITELRYINGDRNRPIWVNPSRPTNMSPFESMETTVYGVTHWAPLPVDPIVGEKL